MGIDLTPESIAAEITKRKDEIIQDVVTNLKQKLGSSVEYNLQSEISQAVSVIVKEQMLEEIKEAVIAAKPQIIEEINLACAKVAAGVGVAMVKKSTEKLTSYSVDDIIKKVFGIY